MNVFLSWSGNRSHEAAAAFRDWLPVVLQAVTPWLSSRDIEKGSTWVDAIGESLQASNGVGLFFLTPEALKSQWMLFEAGSIARLGRQRVCAVLVGIDKLEVPPPMNLFQSTTLIKEDIKSLIKDLNKLLPAPVDESAWTSVFERSWPSLETRINAALAIPVVADEDLAADNGQGAVVGGEIQETLVNLVKMVERVDARMGSLERKVAEARTTRVPVAASPRKGVLYTDLSSAEVFKWVKGPGNGEEGSDAPPTDPTTVIA